MKFLYLGFNSLLVLIDVILDVLMIGTKFGLVKDGPIDANEVPVEDIIGTIKQMPKTKLLNFANIGYSILKLEWGGIAASLLGFIPEHGNLAAGIGGIGVNIIKLIRVLFFKKKNKAEIENKPDKKKISEIDIDADSSINTEDIVKHVKKNCKKKRKFIPKEPYDKIFYTKIKDL